MCVSVSDDINTSALYQNLLNVALKSAKLNTSLNIIVLYDGPENHDFSKLIDSYSVKRINWRFSHFEDLKHTYTKEVLLKQTGKDSIDYKKLAGTFMRMDIPFIERDDQYVLYVDIDVMFMSDLNLESLPRPKVVMVGPEFNKSITDAGYFNAGILYFNVEEMKKKSTLIFKQLESHIPNSTGLFDQGYLNDFCFDDYEELPLEYNWKPYWGTNENAKIVHFHGIKPGGSESESGFTTDSSIYLTFFLNHISDVVGYSKYLKTFFSFCDNKKEDWLSNHLTKVLACYEHDYFKVTFNDYKKLRKKYIKTRVLNFITFGLISKYRKKEVLLKESINRLFD